MVFVGCVEGVCRVSGKCFQGVWKVCGRCMEGVWRRVEGVWNLLRVYGRCI